MPSYFHSTSQSAGGAEPCVEALGVAVERVREEERIRLAGVVPAAASPCASSAA